MSNLDKPMATLYKCCVISPFGGFHDSYYEEILKPSMEEIQIDIIRTDDIYHTTAIIEVIFDQILHSDFLIADISEKNSNVYYELGAAHSLEKPVILIAEEKERDKVPFDIKHLKTIFYDTRVPKWPEKLKSAIQKTVSSIKQQNKKHVAWTNPILKRNTLEETVESNSDFNKLLTFLKKIYYSSRAVKDVNSIIYCSEDGHCDIQTHFRVKSPQDMFFSIYRIFADKPGTIKVVEIFELPSRKKLDHVVLDKSDRDIRIMVLFNEIKKKGVEFDYVVKFHAENYFANIIDKGAGSQSMQSIGKFKHRSIIEKIHFPNKGYFKNLSATYLGHPNTTLVNTAIIPDVNDEHIIFELKYKHSRAFSSVTSAEFKI